MTSPHDDQAAGGDSDPVDGDGPSPAERTALASDRTMLANERTLAAWMRTAMTAVAAAIAFAKLYEGAEPAWLVKGGASFLIAVALVLIGAGLRRYRETTRRLHTFTVDAPSNLALSLATILLACAAIGAGAALWLL